MPNTRPALAMLIVGFSVTGAVILAVAFGQIRWLIKQRYAQINRHVRF